MMESKHQTCIYVQFAECVVLLILIAFVLGLISLCIPTVSSFQDNVLFEFK